MGLTQVLNDGANKYLYRNGRIAQVGNSTVYFLGDACIIDCLRRKFHIL